MKSESDLPTQTASATEHHWLTEVAAAQRLGMEAAGHEVQYVTSQIYTRRQFDTVFAQQRIVSHASAHFLPSEIGLPDETAEHHVSFRAEDAFGYVYSPEGQKFERELRNFDSWMPRIRERLRSYDENLLSLENAVRVMSMDVPSVSPLGRLLRDKPIEQKASILAYATLDAQLTFVRKV